MENTREIKIDTAIFEEMRADFLDVETILEAPRVLYRWHEGERRYFAIDPDGSVRWFISTTTAWKYALPKGEHLIKWLATYPGGYAAALNYRDERADYGTLLHILISRFLITGAVDLAGLADTIEAHKRAEDLDWDTKPWARQIKKDLLAFAQFAGDFQVRPIAIEIVLGSDALATAGAVDIVCQLTVSQKSYEKSGALKPAKNEDDALVILGLGDWKSSLSGFHRDAEYQVATNNLIWRANYPDPDLQPAVLFLWRPKDWRGKPNYELKNATDCVSAREARLGLRWARRLATIKPATVKEYGGTLELRTAPGEDNVREIDPDDYVYETVIRPKREQAELDSEALDPVEEVLQ
jgi:hypothetical protein